MSKRAEEKALEAYPDISYDGKWQTSRLVERMTYEKGYKQAEKDTIERAYEWLCSHAASYIGLAQVFKKAMEEK